jgi:hypothetical protein
MTPEGEEVMFNAFDAARELLFRQTHRQRLTVKTILDGTGWSPQRTDELIEPILHAEPLTDEELARVKCPVLLLHGSVDVLSSRDTVETLKEKLVNGTPSLLKRKQLVSNQNGGDIFDMLFQFQEVQICMSCGTHRVSCRSRTLLHTTASS